MVNGLIHSGGFLTTLINGVRVKIVPAKTAMKEWGITKPTFIKYRKAGVIRAIHLEGDEKHLYITGPELARVKKLLTPDEWKRGKSLLKKGKKGAKRG